MNCPNCYKEPVFEPEREQDPAAQSEPEAAPAPEIQPTSVRSGGQVGPRFVSSIEDKANFLANVQLFKHLSREVLQKLASRIHLVVLPAGHVIKENEPTEGLYIIKSGMAQVTKPAAIGALAIDLATLAQGESFGEIGLIDGLPRSATVTAIKPMTYYYLPRPVFLTTVSEDLEISLGFLPAMASMIRNADEIAQTILAMFVKEK
jgi:CRP-like cAMP-binding protein